MRIWVVFFLGAMVQGLSMASDHVPLNQAQIADLLTSNDRLDGDGAEDANRKPLQTLTFSRIARGDNVLDLYAGGGWYTELFSMAVGAEGLVYAHNDSLTWRFGGKELVHRTSGKRLKNVSRLDQLDLSEIDIPNASIDIAFMGINYHDLFFTSRVRNGVIEEMREQAVDYRSALKTLHSKLKENGVLIITDHLAKLGSGYIAANQLHRIDPNIVKFQLREAGFDLLEEAFHLRNPDDDLNSLVFDPHIRGKTSRFVYKFGKAK